MMATDQAISVELSDRSYRIIKNQQLNVIKDLITDSTKSHTAKPDIKVEGCVPVFKTFDHETSSGNFKMPELYIRYDGREAETDTEQVEYDLDREDINWLKLANERRKRLKEKPITEGILEKAIDRFEKESHFQLSKNEPEPGQQTPLPVIDNDAACCICNDAEDSNVNQIIFCDMCNIAVHQECYGVPYIPEGQWLCRRCQLSPSVPVRCVLCPYTSGAFKQTSDGAWAHVICVLWLNEVHFANTVFLEPVEGVEFTLKRRCKLRCLVCKNKVGACLQCSKKSCTRSFHVTCAYFSGMHMAVKHEKKEKCDSVVVNRYVYCHDHTPPGSKINTTSHASWKRIVTEQIKKARKQIQSSAKETSKEGVSIPVIPPSKVEEIRDELKLDNMEDVCYYWALKRRSRCGVPLIRRLQVYHTQKTLGRRSNEFGTTGEAGHLELPPEHIKVARLRNNLERVRLLCELVKKREKYKKEFMCTSEMIIERCMKPISEILLEALNKLVQKDHMNIFTQPVTEEEVPGYKAIIKHPMDFQTMKTKLNRGDYKRIADLKHDFTLMMDNCAKFNRENSYFLTYGHRIRRIGLLAIKSAEKEEAKMNSSHWLFTFATNLNLLRDSDLEKLAEKEEFDSKPDSETIPKLSQNNVTSPGVPKDNENDTPTIPLNATTVSRKRKSRCIDFFNIPSLPKRNSTASFNGNGSYRSGKKMTDYITEASSASDTGGATSMDELDEPKRKRTSQFDRRKRCFPGRITRNEFDSPDPNTFSHNDIVWVPLESGNKMPARVIDLRMKIHFTNDFPIDKALANRPTGNTHTLVLLFDLASTWKWVPTNRLRHCDVSIASEVSKQSQTDALKRARNFFHEIIRTC